MRYFLILAVVPFLLAGCFQRLEYLELRTSAGAVQLKVLIADTPEERQLGLMNKEALANDRGMWFVFPDKNIRQFWMKNMKIPLDVIFFDDAKKVVRIVKDMQPCNLSDVQCPQYSSGALAKFALEANAGWAEKNAISLGDEAVIDGGE